jgi:hypothetical protein
MSPLCGKTSGIEAMFYTLDDGQLLPPLIFAAAPLCGQNRGPRGLWTDHSESRTH